MLCYCCIKVAYITQNLIFFLKRNVARLVLKKMRERGYTWHTCSESFILTYAGTNYGCTTSVLTYTGGSRALSIPSLVENASAGRLSGAQSRIGPSRNGGVTEVIRPCATWPLFDCSRRVCPCAGASACDAFFCFFSVWNTYRTWDTFILSCDSAVV